MNYERGILDLLYWMRACGVTPKYYRRSDRFLNPFTRKIVPRRQLNQKQLSYVLWIPTQRGLRDQFPNLKTEEIAGVVVATNDDAIGVGPGEAEALLSMLNTVKIGQVWQSALC